MKSKVLAICLVLAVVFLGWSCAKPALPTPTPTPEPTGEDVAAFYEGKVMRFIVGWSPGGGYDTYSRLLAAALEKQLGNTVVVENMPGAGGMLAMNYMSTTAKRDGLVLAITPTGLPLTQALGAEGVKFDCREFNWLASIVRDTHVIGVAQDSPYKSLEDLLKAEKLTAATTEVTSPLGQPLIIMAEALGMDNLKVVAGYSGTTECILAATRGEVDFTAGSTHHFLGDDALLRPLVTIAIERCPELPDAPAITEFGVREAAERMTEILFAGRATGRSVITAPGVPEGRVEFLRNTIMTCLQDPELLERAQKSGLAIDPQPGEQIQAIAEKAVLLSPEEAQELKYIICEKYLR